MSDDETGNTKMTVTRRPHKKTRSGCGTCKRRRIKCDETKPSCLNCTKHSLTCVYGPQAEKPAPPTSTGSGSLPTHVQQSPGILSPATPNGVGSPFGGSLCAPDYMPALSTYGLAMDQLELLQQYLTFTCATTAIGSSNRDYMRVTVPTVGMAYPFIMHECLALAALHLSRFRHDRLEHYQSLSKYHNDAALRLATPTLREITSENCHAVFMFTTLAFCYTLGKGPQDGDYMIFSDHGAAEAFPLLRGTRAVLESHDEILRSGLLAPIFRDADEENQDPGPIPAELQDVIENLSKSFVTARVENLDMYASVIADLRFTFSHCYTPDGTKRTMKQSVAFSWLYRLPMEFAIGLQRKEPAALAILGLFCVVLNELAIVWWMEGWSKHVFAAVYRFIGPAYRNWIVWPMEQIGWLPSISGDFIMTDNTAN